MNKEDFIEKIAETANVSKKNADAVMKAFVGVTTEVLKSDDKIHFLFLAHSRQLNVQSVRESILAQKKR